MAVTVRLCPAGDDGGDEFVGGVGDDRFVYGTPGRFDVDDLRNLVRSGCHACSPGQACRPTPDIDKPANIDAQRPHQ